MVITKIVYSAEIVDLVVHIYGKGSNIYSAMLKGEAVSGLIKSEIKSKAKGKGGAFRIKDKKKLLALVKNVESEFNLGKEDFIVGDGLRT